MSEQNWLDLTEHTPRVDEAAWVAPNATLVGDVRLAGRVSVWYSTVLRGDGDTIEIGEDSNIQDGSVVHTDPGFPVRVGRGVTVGHHVVLHGCRVDDGTLIGMGSVVMNGAHIGESSLVAAGSVVLEGTEVPAGSLVAGVPAKVRRELSEAERAGLADNAGHYLAITERHRALTDRLTDR